MSDWERLELAKLDRLRAYHEDQYVRYRERIRARSALVELIRAVTSEGPEKVLQAIENFRGGCVIVPRDIPADMLAVFPSGEQWGPDDVVKDYWPELMAAAPFSLGDMT